MYFKGVRQRRLDTTLEEKVFYTVALIRDPGFHVHLKLDLVVYLVGWLKLGLVWCRTFNDSEMPEVPWHNIEEGTQRSRDVGKLKWIYFVKVSLSSPHYSSHERPECLPFVKGLRNAGVRGTLAFLKRFSDWSSLWPMWWQEMLWLRCTLWLQWRWWDPGAAEIKCCS